VSRYESWMIHLANLLVGGTGLVYAWMLYLVRPTDPYAVINHPWQPQVQHLHILVAPLLVFAVGLVWRRHFLAHWKGGVQKGRRSGVSLAFILAPMVVSGYLIQTAVDDGWRKAWVAVHLATSALWLAGYLAHQVPLLWAWLRSRRSNDLFGVSSPGLVYPSGDGAAEADAHERTPTSGSSRQRRCW
jgi:hypothetical protein